MKKYLPILLLSVFLIVLCGAPSEGPSTETKPPEKGTAENIAYTTLTESELQKFFKAVPVFKEEVKKNEDKLKDMDTPDNVGAWLGNYSTLNTAIAGLDAKLKAAGMSWNEFWPAFAKTTMAFTAVMYDSSMAKMKKEMGAKDQEIAEFEAKLNDPKVPEQEKEIIKASLEMMKQMKKSLEETENIYTNVPKANKDLVKKHWEELVDLMETD